MDKGRDLIFTCSVFIDYIKEKVDEKVDKKLTKFAFADQFDKVGDNIGYKDQTPHSEAFWKGRKAKLLMEISGLNLSKKKRLSLGFKRLWNNVRIIRRMATTLIHPAAMFWSEKKGQVFDESFIMSVISQEPKTKDSSWAKMSEQRDLLIEEKRGRAVEIFTEDHTFLDGCIVQPSNPSDEQRPLIVFVLGQSGVYESEIETAKDYADTYGIDVLLYNGRGVGRSLGTPHNTGDAVKDLKAALSMAEKLGYDAKKIAIKGHSLGGGIAAEALRQRTEEGKTPIGLYINHHSFTSLGDFFKGFLTEKREAPANETTFKRYLRNVGDRLRQGAADAAGYVSRKGLKIFGLDPLDAMEALSKEELADNTVIITTKGDKIIRGCAQMGRKISEAAENNELLKNISHIVQSDYEHNDEYNVRELKKIETQEDLNKTLDSNTFKLMKPRLIALLESFSKDKKFQKTLETIKNNIKSQIHYDKLDHQTRDEMLENEIHQFLHISFKSANEQYKNREQKIRKKLQRQLESDLSYLPYSH